MPCACKFVPPEYPEIEHWGPLLWMILHSLAEHGGKTINPLFRPDELRQWPLVIVNLPSVIPCPDCREHAAQWIATHPIAAIKTVPHEQLYTWLTTYIYDFHESVNQRVGKPSFDKTKLAETYKGVRIGAALRALNPFMESAIQLSGLRILSWKKWIGFTQMLISLYGA